MEWVGVGLEDCGGMWGWCGCGVEIGGGVEMGGVWGKGGWGWGVWGGVGGGGGGMWGCMWGVEWDRDVGQGCGVWGMGDVG